MIYEEVMPNRSLGDKRMRQPAGDREAGSHELETPRASHAAGAYSRSGLGTPSSIDRSHQP
jgi:hypothetical protein